MVQNQESYCMRTYPYADMRYRYGICTTSVLYLIITEKNDTVLVLYSYEYEKLYILNWNNSYWYSYFYEIASTWGAALSLSYGGWICWTRLVFGTLAPVSRVLHGNHTDNMAAFRHSMIVDLSDAPGVRGNIPR